MRFIDISGVQPAPEWVDKANRLTDELHKIKNLDKKKEFIEKNKSFWRELESWLKEQSFGKCWYSEARDSVSYWHVDHFRPKSEVKDLDGEIYEGYWWLAFNWTNYRLAGSASNVPKSSKFPVRPGTNWISDSGQDFNDEEPYLLDPTKPLDPALLTFDESGKVCAAYEENVWHKERAEVSIDILNLNFNGLVDERHIVWSKCDKKINHVLNLMEECKILCSVTKKTEINDIIVELREMARRKSPFSSVVKTFKNNDNFPRIS